MARGFVTPAWGSDVGGIFKLGKKAVLQTALWYLWMKQEFVYVGDAGVVEPGGKTQRMGWDASLRYEIIPALYADVDLNYTHPKALNEPKAENNLAIMYFNGTGVEKSSAEGVKWFKLAAKHKYAPAMVALGNYYLKQGEDKDNQKAAFGWYLEAAENADWDATFILGYFYELGIGTKQSDEIARKIYLLAA
ncbi:MAG: sel1 repeat family protein, partial [Sphingobacteriales bacterium]